MKLFDINTVESVVKQINLTLRFPYVHVHTSTLGGDKNVAIFVTISSTPKQFWINGILQNSKYAKFRIDNNGSVEKFTGHQLKFRKFTAKSIGQIVEKINNIKEI